MLRCLCGPPSIPLSFNLAIVLPRRNTYCVNCGTEGWTPPTPSIHRLRHGLPGHLILFATHAFVPQRQLQSRKSPSPRSEEHTSELQSRQYLVCRLLLENKKPLFCLIL